MDNLHQLIVDRRSIRRYIEKPIDGDCVKTILEAGLMAPTSKNSRAWEFVVVEDKETLARLAHCKEMGAGPIANAPIAVVVSVDMTVTDPWIEDASIASAFMQLQAAELGIGSCWIQVRGRFTADGTPSEDYVRELLGMPEALGVVCVLTFGYPDEQRKPHDPEKTLWERVHLGQWSE